MITSAVCAVSGLVRHLNEEEQRGIREQLDGEQLAIFDILTQPGLKFTKAEREQVKHVAPGGTSWRFAGTSNALYGGDGGIEE